MPAATNPLAPLVHRLRQSVQPLRVTCREYNRGKFGRDLLAGLTVAVVEVPQAMAYAVIAGVSPVYGLYTSVIQGLVGALFSSNDNLATGPTNTHALLVASIAAALIDPGNPELYLRTVFALALVKGLIQLLFGVVGMGAMVRYVSQSVIIGFTSGAGLLIAVGQVPAFLGLTHRAESSVLPGAFGDLHRLLPVLHEVNTKAVMLGLLALAVVLVMRMISKLLPGPLLAVLLSAIVVKAMGWTAADLPLVPDIPRALPTFALPTFHHLQHPDGLISGALALALLGMIETVAIGKTMTARTGKRLDPDQEFIAQGLCNITGGLFSNIPGTGSFTRTALNYEAGGQTRFASVFNAVFVAAIYLLCAPAARLIPMSALAAVLFVVAYGLIDWKHMWRIAKSDRHDALVMFLTLAGALTLPLKYAIYVGIFASLAIFLRRASRLHMAEMVGVSGGSFLERPLVDRAGAKSVVLMEVVGDLFFGVADELQDRLTTISRGQVRVVVIRLKQTLSIDATVLAVLDDFVRRMLDRGGYVVLCGVRPDLHRVLTSYGLVKLIGSDNVFQAGPGVFSSVRQALRRAGQLVGSSIDHTGLDTADEVEGWFYDI